MQNEQNVSIIKVRRIANLFRQLCHIWFTYVKHMWIIWFVSHAIIKKHHMYIVCDKSYDPHIWFTHDLFKIPLSYNSHRKIWYSYDSKYIWYTYNCHMSLIWKKMHIIIICGKIVYVVRQMICMSAVVRSVARLMTTCLSIDIVSAPT